MGRELSSAPGITEVASTVLSKGRFPGGSRGPPAPSQGSESGLGGGIWGPILTPGLLETPCSAAEARFDPLRGPVDPVRCRSPCGNGPMRRICQDPACRIGAPRTAGEVIELVSALRGKGGHRDVTEQASRRAPQRPRPGKGDCEVLAPHLVSGGTGLGTHAPAHTLAIVRENPPMCSASASILAAASSTVDTAWRGGVARGLSTGVTSPGSAAEAEAANLELQPRPRSWRAASTWPEDVPRT